tara:strand:- start:587 stop:1138 length:552 start_codon:yes stop_codon:yes gene_type:complete
MPIKIKLGGSAEQAEAPKPPQATISLKIKKTLDNNLLIDDHEYMDVIIVPSENKIMSLPKPDTEKDVFEYQKDMMDSLFRGGVTEPLSTQGGPRFGVVEATYPSEAEVDPLQAVLLQISEFMKRTSSAELAARSYDKNIEDNFVDPPDDETTAYGEVPPYEDTPDGESQGSISYSYAGYGYLY